MADWSPSTIIGYRSQIIWKGVVSKISHFVLKRTVDSPSPRWNILRYLATTTRGLTKISKNFQRILSQVRYHILSDSLEYWHLRPEIFIRKYYVAYLKYHAPFKPSSSPSFGRQRPWKNDSWLFTTAVWLAGLLPWILDLSGRQGSHLEEKKTSNKLNLYRFKSRKPYTYKLWERLI